MIAAELRLGNWVNTIVSDKPSIVTFIKSQKVKDGYYQSVELDEEEIYIPQHICGIPLTADILERAGFETYESEDWKGRKFYLKDKEKYHPKYSRRYFLTLFKNGRCMVCIVARDNVKLADVYYLHQLQNLIHALTGEELTINLLSASAARLRPVLIPQRNCIYTE